MSESVRAEGLLTFKKMFDLRVLFKSRARRYRIGLNIAFSWFGQFSGNNIASYYLPYLVANVGIKDTSTQLLLNIIYAIGGWIPAIIGARLHDVVGRRKLMMSVALGMSVCLFITAGTAAGYVHTGSKASSSASIAFIYVFGSTFALGYTSMQPIYPGEVLSNDMRAKGMGVLQLVGGCAGFVNTFAAPVALNNVCLSPPFCVIASRSLTLSQIGYWFYVFFAFFDIFEFIIIYFFFVETKGRTLEELDAIFEAKNPRKASTMKTTLRHRVVKEEDGAKRVSVEEV
jgi:MFS family permease